MPNIDFPTSPAVNDTYTFGTKTWKWTGSAWISTTSASPLGVVSGGTGLSSYTAGDILYASGTATLSKLAIGTNGQTLTLASGIPSWVNIAPAGVVQMYGGTAAPTGWLLCDGTAVNRTTYATLFAAISTNYGVGDGSTTFNLPDFRGRAPIGVGTGAGLTARTIGTNYGAETVTLSSANIPSLTTGNESANHLHTPQVDATTIGRAAQGFSAIGTGYQGILMIRGSDSGSNSTTTTQSANHTHTYTNASPTATSILSPHLAINYIIKT